MVGRGRAGVEVGGDGDGDTGVDECPGGGRVLVEVHRGERERDGDDAGGGEGRDAGLGDALEMVGRDGGERGGELGAPAGGQLVDVQLGAQSEFLPALRDAPRLLGREGGILDEHVDEVGQALRGHRR